MKAAKRFDTARLFEPWRATNQGYRSDEAELDAIRARKKGMSYFSVTIGDVERPGFVDWLELAFDRELVVSFHRPPTKISARERQHLQIFMSHAQELWRVPAYLALWETAFVDGRWSDASENLCSHLLGYTKAERKRWIEKRRKELPAWTAGTAFVLLTRAQRAMVESVSRRCFGPAESVDALELFVRSGVLRRDAFARVPKGMTLARAGIRHQEFSELFPAKKREGKTSWERTLDHASATILNRGLVSNVQFLTGRGWR